MSKPLMIRWRGTIGLGDAMMALNCAHYHAWHKGCKIKLVMYWDHEESYYHHFEDPETIVDRMQYIHRFYLHREQVQISHIFNHRGVFYYEKKDFALTKKNRYEFEDHFYHNVTGSSPPNLWCFDKYLVDPNKFVEMGLVTRKSISTKVVIWRPIANAEPPRRWKRKLTNDEWDVIITKLRQAGLHVVELTYRTPIREAMFHLQTCRATLSYDGMWHYVARNMCLPSAVVSDEPITNYHTPRRYTLILHHHKKNQESVWKWLNKMHEFLGETKRRSFDHKKELSKFYKNKSLQEWAKKWQIHKEGPTLIDRPDRPKDVRPKEGRKRLKKPIREIK